MQAEQLFLRDVDDVQPMLVIDSTSCKCHRHLVVLLIPTETSDRLMVVCQPEKGNWYSAAFRQNIQWAMEFLNRYWPMDACISGSHRETGDTTRQIQSMVVESFSTRCVVQVTALLAHTGMGRC